MAVMRQFAHFAKLSAAFQQPAIVVVKKKRARKAFESHKAAILAATKVDQVFQLPKVVPNICSPARGEAAKALVAAGFIVMTCKGTGPHPSTYRRIK